MRTPLLWTGVLLAIWFNGCAVMPRHLMDEALPNMPFTELAQNADKYTGDTVILGGFVLAVENFKDHTRMLLLQSPLGVGQRPKSKDLSQGRLVLLHKGFLDSEVFAKDRRVTVGGRILEQAQDKHPHYPHIRVAVREIHLWPIETKSYNRYWHDDWPYYRWGWRHHRHRHYW